MKFFVDLSKRFEHCCGIMDLTDTFQYEV